MRKLAGLTLCIMVVVSACSGDDDASSTRRRPSTSAPARPTASVSFRGGVGLNGNVSDPSVRCNVPALDGSSIAVLGQPLDSTLQARVAVQPDKVKVVVSSGSGPDYHERTFEGNGVASFDPAHGAVIDSELTEAAPGGGSTPGSVGAVTAIEASVDCGDQTTGSSTVTLTGDTPDGRFDGAVLDPVRVECGASPDGDEVFASGITTAGSRRVLVTIGLTSDGGVTVNKYPETNSRQYGADGDASITSRGAQVRATVVEQGTAATAHSLEVDGKLTCGLNAAG